MDEHEKMERILEKPLPKTETEPNFATEVLKQMKDTTHKLWVTIWVLIGALFLSTIAWLWVWNQYDYTSSYEYTATGLNVIVDSEGNIVAKDVPDDMIIDILKELESINSGNNKTDGDQNAN